MVLFLSLLMTMNLILHYDINKTIIISDASTNRGLRASLHSLMSEVCWGRFPESIPKKDRRPSDWEPVVNAPDTVPPTEDSVTFGTYLEDHTDIPKTERRRLKNEFACEGNIGERFMPYVRNLERSLTIEGHTEADKKFHFVVPAFYRLLDVLFSDELLQRVNWRIVFRSFGVDTPDVIADINRYLAGDNPQFQPSNPDVAAACKIDLPRDTGALLRTGPSSDDVHISVVNDRGVVTTISGAVNIQNHIENSVFQMHRNDLSGLTAKRFFVLRDDYRWWERNHESDTSGKLLIVQRPTNREAIDSLIHQAFFDDNIERDRPHIVDVRDVFSFEPIPFSSTRDNALIRAEPYLAITDDNYFVSHFKRLLDQWTE